MTAWSILRRARTYVIGAAAALSVTGVWAAVARADIYWTDGNSIGRASSSGAHPNPSFITGASDPFQVAVNSSHLYWANSYTGYVGRAKRNGTGVDQTFINTFIEQHEGPLGVALTGTHIYWSTGVMNDYNLIGDAKLNGSSPNPFGFIPAFSAVQLATHGNYLYWSTGGNTIGRAKLDGSNAINFITLPFGYTQGVAVNDHYIYWTMLSGEIGRDTLDGNPANITTNFIPGAKAGEGIAVDREHIYWTSSGAIARDTINGNPAHVDLTFITNTGGAVSLAVGPTKHRERRR